MQASTGSAVGSCRAIELTAASVAGAAGEDHAAYGRRVDDLNERRIVAPQTRMGAAQRLAMGSSSCGLLRQRSLSRLSTSGRTTVIDGSRSTQKITRFPAIRFLP